MAQKTPKFAIFDYFESETVEVGRVSDIKWDTDEHDLKDIKDNGKVISVCWSIKGPTKKSAWEIQSWSFRRENLEFSWYVFFI